MTQPTPNVNTLGPRQNGHHFADDIFKWIFLNENVWFPIKISLKFVPKDLISNFPALVQIMAWRRPGDKPLSETMMVILPTHICVTRSQRVNSSPPSAAYMSQWTRSSLVQVLACRHYPNRCWFIVNWNPGNKFQWYLNRNSLIFIREMHLEMSSAKMAAILSEGGWANT